MLYINNDYLLFFDIRKDTILIRFWLDDHYQLHRMFGPAKIYASGRGEFYYHGKLIICNTIEEFSRIIKLSTLW